ncbi:MAG: hypothetical protein AAGE90_11450 [Pseudomonadota bacterium]
MFLSDLQPLTLAPRPGIGVRHGRATGPSATPNDLVICRRSRPVLVLHERRTRLTLMARLMGKTAAETVSTMMAVFARHMMLRGMLSATTYFCDAYASWQKGGVESASGRIRRWLPRKGSVSV